MIVNNLSETKVKTWLIKPKTSDNYILFYNYDYFYLFQKIVSENKQNIEEIKVRKLQSIKFWNKNKAKTKLWYNISI